MLCMFAANNPPPPPKNQTVNNPINVAEDTLQIIRLQIGGSERAGGGGKRGLLGKRLETTKGRSRSFLHMWVCVNVSNQSGCEGGKKKKSYTTSREGGRVQGESGGAGRRIEYAYACTWKSLRCSLAVEVIQLARGQEQFISVN